MPGFIQPQPEPEPQPGRKKENARQASVRLRPKRTEAAAPAPSGCSWAVAPTAAILRAQSPEAHSKTSESQREYVSEIQFQIAYIALLLRFAL